MKHVCHLCCYVTADCWELLQRKTYCGTLHSSRMKILILYCSTELTFQHRIWCKFCPLISVVCLTLTEIWRTNVKSSCAGFVHDLFGIELYCVLRPARVSHCDGAVNHVLVLVTQCCTYCVDDSGSHLPRVGLCFVHLLCILCSLVCSEVQCYINDCTYV